MKITIELPDSTQGAFINYIAEEDFRQVLVSKSISKKDLENGYKDCSKYEVSE
jgi:hypothetical protein